MNIIQAREAQRKAFRTQQMALYPVRKPDLTLGRPDFNAGVISVKSEFDRSSSFFIHMHLGDPGRYFTDQMTPVPESMAKEAGMDVERHGKLRRKIERMSAAEQAINDELDLEEALEDKPLAEGKGFKVIAMSMGRAFVMDPDGNKLPIMTKEQALKVFDKFTQEGSNDPTVKANGKKKE